MASLSLQHINKTYPNGFQAVKDFNLEIEDKEFIIFVGPSGCGKSTTLRMIAGLEEITSGTLKIGDRVVNDVEPKDRDIAMVFQNYALYPHMTVYDNMAFGLKLRKDPKDQIDKAVREAARILDLEKLLDRKPKALSGGQRQRVAMGRAIVRNPKVFLMDEPLSNLDAKLRVQMRIEISKIHQRLGATIIYVTHDQTEAMTLGTRIVVMKDGVVQQVDTPQNLYQKPGNLFVAGFMGSPQMNFLDAVISEKGGNLIAKVGEHELVIPAAKRVMDILISGIGIIITSPIMLIIATAVKAYDRGPVFYFQDRLTLGGKPFKICKFRSMCVDSEKNGARLASKHDSRITPVGHVLRNLHLDELPQLFNVFKGDMSLVGPRPERESIMLEYEKELPEFYYRLKVKAGLTGYAQVYGKYNTTPYDKLKLDLFYIENYSFLLDIKLIFMTVKIFFQKEVSEGVDDRQVNALKDSGKNAGVSENKTEE